MAHHDEHAERPLFLLGPIAACLRWLEELANLLSGPLLVAGLAIALIDLLTDGALLTSAPVLLYAWAIAQAIGVDANLIGAFDRAKRAILRRQWWHMLGLLALGVALAYVAYVAGYVFAVQESNHISEAAALASLGMNATTWLWQRVGVSVFLVCLSGWSRYRTPRAQTTLEDEQAKLQRELTLEPLRQQVRGAKLAGVRLAASALTGVAGASGGTGVATMPDAARPSDGHPVHAQDASHSPIDAPVIPGDASGYVSPDGAYAYVQRPTGGLASVGVRTPTGDTPTETPGEAIGDLPNEPTPPTGPGSPTTAPVKRTRQPSQPGILRLEPDRPRRQRAPERQAAQGKAPVRTPGTNDSLEAIARQAFTTGATSIAKMRRATGMSQSAAQSWVRTLKMETAATTAAPRIMPAPTTPAAQQWPLPGSAFRGILAGDDTADDATTADGERMAL